MAVSITAETPLQDDVRALVAALNAHLLPLSPVEFQYKMTVEQMAGPAITVFVARDEAGRAVGMGALKVEEDGLAEVKRMFTLPAVRGQRVGTALLDRIEALAREKGVTRLMLETGIGDGFAAAHRLYLNRGFVPCDPFLDYPDSGHSAFFEKQLGASAVA